jgi:LacI family transcriptional regulator
VTRAAGFDLLISTSGGRPPRPGLPMPLGPHNTDGILIFADSLDEAGLRGYQAQDFPMVLIHTSAPAGLEIPCVTVENKAASRRLVEHLIVTHGCRHILFLHGPRGQEDSHWRQLGYTAALEDRGIPVDPALIAPGDFERTTAQATTARLLASGIAIDAVFAADDESAVGVYAALRAAGRRVPEDVAVVGFDDQRFSAYLTPPLTTVRAPTGEVGRTAARQLVRLVRGEPADPLTMLSTEIVIRCSCGCTPAAGEENLEGA